MFAQYRVFIGPALEHISDSTFYDWSSIDKGGALPFGGQMSLTTGITGMSSALSISGGTLPGAAGGVFVGPNGSGQTWEYIGFSGGTSSSATGIERMYDPEISQTHSAGAAVYFWYPVPIQSIRYDGQINTRRSTKTWTVALQGVKMPQAAMRNLHLCVVQYRTTPTGTFENYLVGWLLSPTVADDATRTGEWEAKIVSLDYILGGIDAKRVRVGDRNAALDGSASTISVLSTPYKEATSNDYTEDAPDLSAGKAIDGESSTLWISEHVIGTALGTTAINDPAVPGNVMISQIHLSKAPGESDGYRWLELTVLTTGNQPDFACWTSNLGYALLDIGDSYTAGDKIIICEDDVLFQRQNPLQQAVKIISLEDDYPTFLSGLNPAGDSLGLYYTTFSTEGWACSAIWGSGTRPDRGEDLGPAWTGGNAPALTDGRTLRYKFTESTTPKDNWVLDYNDHAGYRYNIHPLDDGAWLLVDLPGMGLRLKDSLSAGHTGVIQIEDDSDLSTGGLDDSGTIQVGQEQITYSSKTDTTITITGRAANSTTDADHAAGDTIYIVDSGVATDAVPISEISWVRYGGTSNYPKNFTVRRSALRQARTPAESNYSDDYETLATVTGHASASYTLSPGTRRIAKLLIHIPLMSVNPSRARLNEFRAILDRTKYDDDWLADGSPATDVFESLLANLPVGAINITSDVNHNLSSLDTESGQVWTVLTDLADYAGYRIDIDLDSKIYIAADNYWTATQTSTKTWNRTNARQVRALRSGEGAVAISQVSLEWLSASGESNGTAVYPTNADWLGLVDEIGPFLYANSTAADAAARKYYYQTKYPVTFVVESALGDLTVQPGQIHTLQWQFDSDAGIVNRKCVVESVSHEFNNQQITTTLTLVQIEREIPN